MPSESGSSGPTMVRSGFSASARRTMAARFLRSTETQRAIWAMPPLPGAQTISVTRELRLTAQSRACSRPPEPRIRAFIRVSFSKLIQNQKNNGRQWRRGKSNGADSEFDELALAYTDAGCVSRPAHEDGCERRDGREAHQAVQRGAGREGCARGADAHLPAQPGLRVTDCGGGDLPV